MHKYLYNFREKQAKPPPWLMERIPNLPIWAPCRFARHLAKRHGRAQKSPASELTGHLLGNELRFYFLDFLCYLTTYKVDKFYDNESVAYRKCVIVPIRISLAEFQLIQNGVKIFFL